MAASSRSGRLPYVSKAVTTISVPGQAQAISVTTWRQLRALPAMRATYSGAGTASPRGISQAMPEAHQASSDRI